MSILASHLRNYVIGPTLHYIGLWSESAENLLLGTAAQESHCGKMLHQVGGGPALGVYQIEPNTHHDVWDNFLKYRSEFATLIQSLASTNYLSRHSPEELIVNLAYATAIARIIYYRVSDPLPFAHSVEALGIYWDLHYNKNPHKGTVEEFIYNYQKYVGV